MIFFLPKAHTCLSCICNFFFCTRNVEFFKRSFSISVSYLKDSAHKVNYFLMIIIQMKCFMTYSTPDLVFKISHNFLCNYFTCSLQNNEFQILVSSSNINVYIIKKYNIQYSQILEQCLC